MSAPIGVRYRRAIRNFRQADLPLRVLTGVIAVVLLADIIGIGGVGGSSSSSSSGGHLASNGAQAGAAGGGSGPGGTTGSGGPGSTTASGGAAGASSSGGPGGTNGPSGTNGPGSSGGGNGPSSSNPLHLTASDRGVTPTSIRVVFPWPNLGPIGQATGLNTSSEDDQLSIHTFVNDINAHGGILGRMIDPEVVSFNPLDDSDMRAKCIQWTQDEKVFAVLDAASWHDDNQLCITQEGHTPLISGWTAVPPFAAKGAPNLWWTGPDNGSVVQNLVHWAIDQKMLTPTTKFGIVAADRSEDTIALHQYLEPALRAAGLHPLDIESMHFDSSDGLDSSVQAPGIVSRMRAYGITTVLPLLPFLNMSAFMNEAKNEKWNPVELLSDYEAGLTSALGLADAGYGNADNQKGPTSYMIGGHEDPRGYTPQGLDCYHAWMKANPGTTPPPHHYLEIAGTAMRWCETIRLFAQAARMAGPNLTRAGFDNAMAQIVHFPGTLTPDLTFGPTRFGGPHLFRTVQTHENGDKQCPKLADGTDQGSCWLILDNFREMVTP